MLEAKTSSTSHHLILMKTVMEIRVAIILQSQIYYFQVIGKHKTSEYSKHLENISTPLLCLKIKTRNEKMKYYLVQKVTS